MHPCPEALACDPTEVLLENAVHEASQNVYAHRLNIAREREYQQQLREAQAALQQYRCNRDPEGFAAHLAHDSACAAEEYANS